MAYPDGEPSASMHELLLKHPGRSEADYQRMLEEVLHERDELRKAGAKVVEGFGEAHIFCRDTREDRDPAWAIKAAPYLIALARLNGKEGG